MAEEVKISETIASKSSQLNADDLISGSLTVTITKLTGDRNKEQPVAVNYYGDNGKPWYPCKTMRRVLAHCWKDVKENSEYAGRKVTLYRDPTVTWAGLAVGGIRISHLSHIDSEITVSLNASNKGKKPVTVKPLVEVPVTATAPTAHTPEKKAEAADTAKLGILAAIIAAKTAEELAAFIATKAETIKRLQDGYPDKYTEIMVAMADKQAALELKPEEIF